MVTPIWGKRYRIPNIGVTKWNSCLAVTHVAMCKQA